MSKLAAGCCLATAWAIALRRNKRLAASIDVVFFDCDDCLYNNNWKVAEIITANIERFCLEKLGLEKGRAYKLYKQHGTCLKGLLDEGLMDESRIEEFLQEAHDIPNLNQLIRPDPTLRSMLLRIDQARRFIFTASVSDHARRCLVALGIDDLFEGIIDCRSCKFVTKHDPRSFKVAMDATGSGKFLALNPARCLFLDDSISNIRAAAKVGWMRVLVGNITRDSRQPLVCPEADHIIGTVHGLEKLPCWQAISSL